MFQHIKKLLLGNGLAQAIQLLSLLVLSRLYTPSDFGLLAQIQAIATFSTIVGTLQLHLATPLSGSDAEARALTSHTQSIAIFLTLCMVIPALLLGKLETYCALLTLTIALLNTYNGYLIYRGNFSTISRFYVARACLVVSFQLLFAFLGLNDGLVMGTLLAEALAALYLFKAGLDHRPTLCSNPRKLFETVKQHRAFTLYGTSQELVSVAAFYAPLVLFGIYFDAATAGQYAMASRLVWAPTVLISKNIAQVVYHAFSKPQATRVKALLAYYLDKRVAITIAAFCIAATFSSEAINQLLGNGWSLTSEIVPRVIFWALSFLVATPYRVLYRVLKKQNILLIFDATLLITIVASFQLTKTALEAVTAIALTGATLQIAAATYIHKIAKSQEQDAPNTRDK